MAEERELNLSERCELVRQVIIEVTPTVEECMRAFREVAEGMPCLADCALGPPARRKENQKGGRMAEKCDGLNWEQVVGQIETVAQEKNAKNIKEAVAPVFDYIRQQVEGLVIVKDDEDDLRVLVSLEFKLTYQNVDDPEDELVYSRVIMANEITVNNPPDGSTEEN